MIINIIGAAPGYEAAFEHPGEHWLINYFDHRGDMLWDMHHWPDYDEPDVLLRDRENAAAIDMPVMNRADYPLDEIMSEYGTDYFASTADYMMALAIGSGVKEIHLWGICMSDIGDHYEKRCCLDFWCGVAIGRGVKVVVHGNSAVMTTEDGCLYGSSQKMKRSFERNQD